MQTRDAVGRDLHELETRARAAVDWRRHCRERPVLITGLAVAAGIGLALLVPKSGGHAVQTVRAGLTAAGSSETAARLRAEAGDVWQRIASALIAVAAARVVQYVSDHVPGFTEHYDRPH